MYIYVCVCLCSYTGHRQSTLTLEISSPYIFPPSLTSVCSSDLGECTASALTQIFKSRSLFIAMELQSESWNSRVSAAPSIGVSVYGITITRPLDRSLSLMNMCDWKLFYR